MVEEMHSTIHIKVCGWSSSATEFPCNHEDSIQPENPKAASALVFESAQTHYGECCSLAVMCPALIHLQAHVHQHGSQPSGPQPAPVNLVRACLGVLSLCPIACTSSAFFFLPHQTFLFSHRHISCFSLSYQTSASHFPLFVLLRNQILLTLVPAQRKATQDKRPTKLRESLSKLLSSLWTDQVSEDNETS